MSDEMIRKVLAEQANAMLCIAWYGSAEFPALAKVLRGLTVNQLKRLAILASAQ